MLYHDVYQGTSGEEPQIGLRWLIHAEMTYWFVVGSDMSFSTSLMIHRIRVIASTTVSLHAASDPATRVSSNASKTKSKTPFDSIRCEICVASNSIFRSKPGALRISCKDLVAKALLVRLPQRPLMYQPSASRPVGN